MTAQTEEHRRVSGNRDSDGDAVRVVREIQSQGLLPVYSHPEWLQRFPWLVQGVTGRGESAHEMDFRLFGVDCRRVALRNWRALQRVTGCTGVAHHIQVHGSRVHWHASDPDCFPGVREGDGHATRSPNLLLAVTIADCVPVFMVDQSGPAAGLLHAGWRSAAAGILEEGMQVLGRRCGSSPENLEVHLGPSICGDCYEVSPQVFAALGLAPPEGPACLDLRSHLARRAMAAGIPTERITRSPFCTRCHASLFFSHRGGCTQRQVAFAGIVQQEV